MKLRVFLSTLGLALTLGAAPLFAQQGHTVNTNDATAVEQTEGNIARMTAALLHAQHYSHHPFDAEIAGKFLDRYLDTLDHLHSYFLQSDLDEFNQFRTNLHQLTVRGNTKPCFYVFDRFMQRAEQRVTYITNLLATEKFEFTGTNRFVADRRKLPNPKDMAEARALWRDELYFEYLQEKLQAPDIKYGGPATVDGDQNAVINVTRDKSHPLSFEFLPKELFDQDGKKIAMVNIEGESNAVVRVTKTEDEKLKKIDRKIYSDKGNELGKITIRAQTNILAAATTNAPNASLSDLTSKTNAPYIGVIQLNQKNMAEVVKTLTNRYTRLMKNFKELDHDDVFEYYMTSLARAYDPHSDYMGHSQAENFKIMMKLSLFGIGAVLQAEDGYCKIAELTPEGPAFKSGKLKPGDRIVAVAQAGKDPVDVVGMKLTKVVEQIRGPKGTEVRLTVIPSSAADSSARQVVTLIRDQIKLDDQAAKAKIYEVPTANGGVRRLGVIDLPAFYGDLDDRSPSHKSPTADVAKLLERLKQENVSGIILDLRRNGGGLLEEAIGLTGLFITKGPVVQTKEPSGEIVTDSDTDESIAWDGPLIVLVSKVSASASEILAGALQDYNRALIVGDRSTFGKGTVQNVQNLRPFFDSRNLPYIFDPGDLKMTIRKFYRAGGSSTQLKGVISDIELPSVLSYWDVGESSMENALPWDEVPSADPQNMNRVTPYLEELKKKSALRVASDKEFEYIRQDIQEFKKNQEDKSVSLNEAERIREKKDREARLEARKKERLTHTKSDEKVFEITLKNINVPELQPPTVKTNDLASAQLDQFDLPEEGAAADPKAPDATLEETKRILSDYVDVVSKVPQISATQGGKSSVTQGTGKTAVTHELQP